MLSARRSRLAVLAVLTAATAAAIAPGVSAAAQRYASPTGIGSACSAASPCDVAEAISSALKGDEVIVRPGDYKLSATIGTPDQMTIHGVAGQPRPRLMFAGVNQSGLHIQFGSLLRHVEIDQAGSGLALYAWGSSVDGVIALGPGAYATAAIENSTIQNSIVTASASGGRALITETGIGAVSSTYRNVTAVATGSGAVAVEAYALTGGDASIDLVNTIAYGAPGASSLRSRTDSSGVHATITASHSDYQGWAAVGIGGALINGGGNRIDAPAFVNAATGDYHQAAGSHMIDSGISPAVKGTTDIDGDPRQIGTATDIGADEFVPAPKATTGPATAVTAQSATLSGSVDGGGAPAGYRFQYGTTTAYGSSTPPSSAAGSGALAVATGVGALSAGTTYHYRVVATTSGGVATGADGTFTTAAPAGGTGAGTGTTSFAGVKLLSPRLTLSRRVIRLRLSCPAGSAGRCTGLTKLTARRPRTAAGAAARVRLGRAAFSIAAGERATVRVRLSRAGRRLFAHRARLRGRAANAAHDQTGGSRTTQAAVTIRRRRALG